MPEDKLPSVLTYTDCIAQMFAIWMIEEKRNPDEESKDQLLDDFDEFLRHFLVASYKYIYGDGVDRYKSL